MKKKPIILAVSVITIVLALIIGSMIFLSHTTQSGVQTIGDMSILSISKTTVNGQEVFRVLASVSRGGNLLDINWGTSDLNSALQSAGLNGYKATKSVSGSLSYDKQSLFFPYSPSSGKIIKSIRRIDAGYWGFCTADKCTSKMNAGETLLYNVRFGLTSTCNCVVASESADQGQFAGSSIGDYQVTFSIDGLGSATTSRSQRSANINSKAFIQWQGNLDSLDKLNAPNYDLALFNSQLYMLDRGTSGLLNTEYNKACGVYSYSVDNGINCNTAGFWSTTKLDNVISNYNAKSNELFQNKFDYYRTSSADAQFIDSATLSNSGLTVFTKNPTSYPVFTIDLNAQSIGIIKLSGQPQVTCPTSCNFSSNQIGNSKITVKNVGNDLGYFGVAFNNCNNINGYIPGSNQLKGLQSGESLDVAFNLNGDTTNTNGEQGTCTLQVYDINNPSSQASCDLSCKINYNPGGQCEEQSSKCDSQYKTVQTCINKQYQTTSTCDNKCSYDDNGKAYCLGASQDNNTQGNSCGYWFQVGSFKVANFKCIIDQFFQKLRIGIAIILGLLTGLIGGWISRDFTEDQKDKTRFVIYLISFLVIGGIIGFLAYTYFWFALICLAVFLIAKPIIAKIMS